MAYPRWCPYFDVMVGPKCSKDPESSAGGSVATGRASHAGQVKGDDQDKKGYPGAPGWVLGVRLTTSQRKNFYVRKSTKMPRMGLINRRRCCYKEKDLILAWNVRR